MARTKTFTPEAQNAEYARMQQYLANPNVRQILNVISLSEGTSGAAQSDDQNGYYTGFAYTTLPNLDSHPGTSLRREFKETSGKSNTSTAAGRYQYMPSTWREKSAELGITDFSDDSQDLVAVKSIVDAGAIDDFIKGDFKKGVSKINGIWTSLPGGGAGGTQRSRPWSWLGGALDTASGMSLGLPNKTGAMQLAAMSSAAGANVPGAGPQMLKNEYGKDIIPVDDFIGTEMGSPNAPGLQGDPKPLTPVEPSTMASAAQNFSAGLTPDEQTILQQAFDAPTGDLSSSILDNAMSQTGAPPIQAETPVETASLDLETPPPQSALASALGVPEAPPVDMTSTYESSPNPGPTDPRSTYLAAATPVVSGGQRMLAVPENPQELAQLRKYDPYDEATRGDLMRVYSMLSATQKPRPDALAQEFSSPYPDLFDSEILQLIDEA